MWEEWSRWWDGKPKGPGFKPGMLNPVGKGALYVESLARLGLKPLSKPSNRLLTRLDLNLLSKPSKRLLRAVGSTQRKGATSLGTLYELVSKATFDFCRSFKINKRSEINKRSLATKNSNTCGKACCHMSGASFEIVLKAPSRRSTMLDSGKASYHESADPFDMIDKATKSFIRLRQGSPRCLTVS